MDLKEIFDADLECAGFERIEEEEFRNVINVNRIGIWMCFKW